MYVQQQEDYNSEEDYKENEELQVTLNLTPEQEEKQEDREKNEPKTREPITRTRTALEKVPIQINTMPQITPLPDPRDKHQLKAPPRRSPRRHYTANDGRLIEKLPHKY